MGKTSEQKHITITLLTANAMKRGFIATDISSNL